MLRVLLSVALAVSIGLTAAAAEGKKKNGPKAPKKTADEIFKAKDKSGDGKLSIDEFVGNPKKPGVKEKLEAAFKKLDKDSDGFLTLDEFKAKPAKGDKPKKNGPKRGK